MPEPVIASTVSGSFRQKSFQPLLEIGCYEMDAYWVMRHGKAILPRMRHDDLSDW